MSPSTKAIPYVLKDNFLQVALPGKAFTLNASHPTFARLKNALKKKQWKKVPGLVNLAETIVHYAHGQVEVDNGVVRYKGRVVQSSLTERILKMAETDKPVIHMVKFMDNLYQNPSESAVRSFYDWLINNELPITDDGCFLAYKSVNKNFKDTHTDTIDNSPGTVISMSRKVVDTDYNHQCSTGFHICSKQYGLYGERVLAVKVNPKHILSAVSGKMRVTHYEVLKDLGFPDRYSFQKDGLSELENQLVIEIAKERKEVIRMLLASDAVKKLIRRRKLLKRSIIKSSYARLKTMLQRFDLVPKLGPEDKQYLLKSRLAAGLTIGQIAKSMGVSYKTVAALEKKESPTVGQEADYFQAISKLTGKSAVTYNQKKTVAA